MSDKAEELIRQMKALTDVVKDHQVDPATMDFEMVKEAFETQIEALVDEQVKEQLEAAPVRHGDPVPSNGNEILPATNRYAKAVRDISRDGFSRNWSATPMKAIDLWMANMMLEAQVALKSTKMGIIGGAARLPSDDLKAALKALTSTGSGTGAELVPRGLASDLWQDIFLASRIVASIDRIPMPTNPFDVPLGLGDVTWRKGTQNTATTGSDPATAKSTLTVTELVTEQNWSYTLEEDAILAMAPAIRARLAISGGEIIDDFALNADATNAGTGNINLDDADPDDDNYYLSDGQDGLRHQWLVDNTGQGVNAGGDALEDSDILGALVLMGKYAVRPDQVVCVADVSTYLKGLLNLDGTLTLDKYGPQAVLLTGELAKYRGVPIVVSSSARLTEADGKLSTTGGSNTLGQITFFNRLMWYAGFLRDLLIEVDRDIQKRQYIMVTSLREAVAAHGTRASATHTAGIRNILV